MLHFFCMQIRAITTSLQQSGTLLHICTDSVWSVNILWTCGRKNMHTQPFPAVQIWVGMNKWLPSEWAMSGAKTAYPLTHTPSEGWNTWVHLMLRQDDTLDLHIEQWTWDSPTTLSPVWTPIFLIAAANRATSRLSSPNVTFAISSFFSAMREKVDIVII